MTVAGTLSTPPSPRHRDNFTTPLSSTSPLPSLTPHATITFILTTVDPPSPRHSHHTTTFIPTSRNQHHNRHLHRSTPPRHHHHHHHSQHHQGTKLLQLGNLNLYQRVTLMLSSTGKPKYIILGATVGQTQNVYAVGAYNQGGNSYQPQGASHGQNSPPAYQAPAYQALGYQAPVQQGSIPQPQVVTTTGASSSGSGTLPGNTVTNPKKDLKGITTRSGIAYKGPTIPTTSSPPKVVKRKTEVTKDMVPPTNNISTKDIQPPVVQVETQIPNYEPVVALVTEPVVEPVEAPVSASKPNPKPSIPYPSRLYDQKLRDKANDQKEKKFQIFQDLNFNISFTDALILMPNPTIKTLLTNKDKLSELARTLLNEHCSAVLLKKLPEKLGDPGKFLILCDFLGMTECLAVADLGASINLMPLSVWNKLSFLDLSPTCMTLELADRELTLRVGKEAITFNLDQTSRYSANYNDMTANRINVIDMACEEYPQEVLGFSDVIANGNPTPYYDPIVSTTSRTLTPFENSDFLLEEVDAFLALEDDPTSPEVDQSYVDTEGDVLLLESFLNDDPLLPPPNQRNYLPQEDFKLGVQNQRRVNPKIHDVIKNEVLKLLDAGLIYPISDSPWLNEATRKDHFPLPFIDQMLERLARNKYYCFLNGFSGYFQIPIDPKDQEKTTFTCPYGTFAYRRMPFGLCNAPSTFQRCMMAIFHDMIEKTMEVFMDDFSVFGNCFQTCLSHLEKMLKRCEDTILCMNWEKSHFMVKEGIVLGHKISNNEIKVDKAKVNVIAKLPHPTTVKVVEPNNEKSSIDEPPVVELKDLPPHLKYAFLEGDDKLPIIIAKELKDEEKTALIKVLKSHKQALAWQHFDIKGGFTIVENEENELIPTRLVTGWRTPKIKKRPHSRILMERLPTVGCLLAYAMHRERSKVVDYVVDPRVPLILERPFLRIGRALIDVYGEELTLRVDDEAITFKVCQTSKCSYNDAEFGTPRAIISDCGMHFFNDQFAKVMLKYSVTHPLATAYHPHTSGQVDVSNRGLKRILERTVGKNHASWSDKLDDAPWAFYTAFKTPIRIVRILKTRARGFVLRSLDLHIFSFILGIQYPNLIN
nr:reverse transcriptase domain-containing protein [Tanacetum cinerariifolium]